MSRHRQQQVRPRYGRIGVATASLAVTIIAVLGGVGALPSAAESADDGAITPAAKTVERQADEPHPTPTPPHRSDAGDDVDADVPGGRELDDEAAPETVLPPDSGEGRRVVFSEGRQRVWLVNAPRRRRPHLPGLRQRLRQPRPRHLLGLLALAAGVGIDDSGTMQYFVRFAHGDNAAIGFHDIPVDEGRAVQSVADLGTPQSHGCIRQKRADAIALWDFAPLGTPVVVTA